MSRKQNKIKKSTRRRKYKKNSTCTTFTARFKTEIKKIKLNGIRKSILEKMLANCKHFIGIYSHNNLSHIAILNHPVFLIIHYNSHYVTLWIDDDAIEIFDSLGSSWKQCPNLLLFLSRYTNHKIIYSNRIQSSSSLLCGLYCIFFIFYRQNHSFGDFINLFKTRQMNDLILLDSLNLLCVS